MISPSSMSSFPAVGMKYEHGEKNKTASQKKLSLEPVLQQNMWSASFLPPRNCSTCNNTGSCLRKALQYFHYIFPVNTPHSTIYILFPINILTWASLRKDLCQAVFPHISMLETCCSFQWHLSDEQNTSGGGPLMYIYLLSESWVFVQGTRTPWALLQ